MKAFTIYCTIIFTFCLFITCKEKNPEEVLTLMVCPKVCGESVTNTMVAGGGTPPYTYQWTGGLGSSTSNPWTTTPTSVGSFTVTGTVTDANGCTEQSTNTINVSLPVLNVINTPDLICPDNINLNIYIGAGTTSPYTFYNGTQTGCNPSSPVGTPTNVALADGENVFTVCNGNLGSGGTCCDCETFSLWSTCDPANATYNVVQLADDLCNDGQICFEVDLSPCEAPAGASWTETVTWSSTPSASGTESDDGTTYQICYTQAQLTAAGIDGGDNFNVQVGVEITNSNTGSDSCGDTNAADIDITIPTCCNCVLSVDFATAIANVADVNGHLITDLFSSADCNGNIIEWFGVGAPTEGTVILVDTQGCGTNPNAGSDFPDGIFTVSGANAEIQAALDTQFGAGELTSTLTGSVPNLVWTVSGTCGLIDDVAIEFQDTNGVAQTAGCTINLFGTQEEISPPNPDCCP